MKLYGAFWCDCIYESGMILQTAHRTKSGAYLASRKFRYQIWVDHRMRQQNGEYKIAEYDYDSYDRPIDFVHTAWKISEIEVLD